MNTATDIKNSALDQRPLTSEIERLDMGVVGGIGISFTLILASILFSGKILNYIDLSSFLIVVGGTFGATLVHYSVFDLQRAWVAFKNVIRVRERRPIDRIVYLVKLAHIVRRDGVLVLEREAERISDPFLRKAFELAVDGHDPREIKRILENELCAVRETSQRAIQVFESLSTYAPALGLIGTLLGLVQLLGSLNSPETVGPAMALAMVTTLYGAVLANLVFLPIAGKLKLQAGEEELIQLMTIEGAIALARQESSIVVEQRLNSYLPRPH